MAKGEGILERPDARRRHRLQADQRWTALPPGRGERNARPVGVSEGAHRGWRNRRERRAARGRRRGGRARAAGAAPATSRAQEGRRTDLDRLLPHGLRRPHRAARQAQDTLAELRRSPRGAPPGQEPARAALRRPADLGRDGDGAGALSHPSRRRALCRVARARSIGAPFRGAHPAAWRAARAARRDAPESRHAIAPASARRHRLASALRSPFSCRGSSRAAQRGSRR